MKITLAFRVEAATGDLWLASAVDEYTIDAWNRLPDFYAEALTEDPGNTRECVIEIPDEAVHRLFAVPDVAAAVLP